MSEYPTYLIHYGIPGQKWGVRRYQNEDGSLTPEGYEHYGREKARSIEQKNLYRQLKKDGFKADVHNNALFNKLVRSNKKYSERKDKIKTLSDERRRLYSELKNSKPSKQDEDLAKEFFWSVHGRNPNLNSKKKIRKH